MVFQPLDRGPLDHGHLGQEGEIPAAATVWPRIRSVDVNRPWVWLAAGWRDLWATPAISLGYGALMVAISFLLVAGLETLEMFYLVLPMAAGFMLVGPIIAVGLYEASRRRPLGLPVTFGAVVGAFRDKAPQLATTGLILTLALLAWIRIAFLIFALFFGAEPPPLDQLVERVFYSHLTVPFLLTGTAVGAVLATIVFAISAVSIPMLLDRDVTTFQAMATSVQAVSKNRKAMAGWAGLIVLFTAAGMVTAFVGLAIALPLIGHATWHAYKDIVE